MQLLCRDKIGHCLCRCVQETRRLYGTLDLVPTSSNTYCTFMSCVFCSIPSPIDSKHIENEHHQQLSRWTSPFQGEAQQVRSKVRQRSQWASPLKMQGEVTRSGTVFVKDDQGDLQLTLKSRSSGKQRQPRRQFHFIIGSLGQGQIAQVQGQIEAFCGSSHDGRVHLKGWSMTSSVDESI